MQNLAEIMARIIQRETPKSQYPSHPLVNNLTEIGPVVKIDRGYSIGIGDLNKIGKADIAPPKGTIKDFLKMYPEFKTGGVRNSAFAWKMLSRQAKDMLQAARMVGLFGGQNSIAAGKSPYAWAQEGSKPAWMASAAKSGITPTYFLWISEVYFQGDAEKYIAAVMRLADV